MPIKYKNGRLAKADDPVVGLDWRGGLVAGTVVTGDRAKGHPELVFQHATFKTVCPSLALEQFLHVEDAATDTAGMHSVTAKTPAAPTGTA